VAVRQAALVKAPLPGFGEGDRARAPGSIKLYESGILLYGSDRRRHPERPIAGPLPICPFRDLLGAPVPVRVVPECALQVLRA
jgi:hypothetical protein